jgi:SAM-dependent methyltransferase
MRKTKEWFGEWFDSHYYHILYKHRDHEEAQEFIDNIVRHLELRTEHLLLDLACGKGRHAIYLNERGYDVVGLDLSVENIKHARQYENDRLHFYVHDMRHEWPHHRFDYIFNLFTSFGYFQTDEEHEEAICAMAKCLKPGGSLLIDFLNPYTVVHNLVPEEVKTIEGIEFHIKKYVKDGFIIKEICFEDEGQNYSYFERVKAIRRSHFLQYFEKAKLNLVHIFGDYQLSDYVAESSDRMIFLLTR